MSTHWSQDIYDLNEKFVGHKKFYDMSTFMKLKFLKYRLDCLNEEIGEFSDGLEAGSSEEVVDGIMDLLVFGMTTLDLFDVDLDLAWDAILEKNLEKEPGIKPERPNPFGLPDLIKPEGWTAPSHKGNHGDLTQVFGEDK